MLDEAILSPNNGVIGVKPIYSDAFIDTFREIMKETELKVQKEFSDGRITGKDYSNVYLGTIQVAMGTAAQLAKDEGESRYKLENMMDLDKRIKQEQIKQLQAETYFKVIQSEQIVQSVYDNRLIKISDQLSSMVGMILNGGTQAVPAGLTDTLISVINTIKVIPRLSYPTIIIDSPIDMYDVSIINDLNIYTIKPTVTITGSIRDVAVGSIINILVNGVQHQIISDADMIWNIDISGSDLVADMNKTIVATVSSSDVLGNVKVAVDMYSYTELPSA